MRTARRKLRDRLHLGRLNETARSRVAELANQRRILQDAYRAEIERRTGKPIAYCTPLEINRARAAIPREWWAEHAPRLPDDLLGSHDEA